MRGPEEEQDLPESEPQLEGSESESESESEGAPEPEPELLPDSDSDSDSDEPEPEPELLPDDDERPRTIFDQSDDDWMAAAQRGFGARQPESRPDSAAARMQWWREKAREDIAARLKDGAAPLPIERQGAGEASGNAAAVWQLPVPADDSDAGSGGVSDGETSRSDAASEQEEVEEVEDEEDEEEAAKAARERELQDMRSEFSDLQDLVKRMRSSSVEPTSGSNDPGQHALRTRSVQEIESQIEASVGLSPPAPSPAGKEAEVAGWLVTRRLARAEELIVELEGATVDDDSASMVSSPFKVEQSAAAAAAASSAAASNTAAATPPTVRSSPGPGSRRKPRRSPGTTRPSSSKTTEESVTQNGHRRSGSSAGGQAVREVRTPAAQKQKQKQKQSLRVSRQPPLNVKTPNAMRSASTTPRRSAQRPGGSGPAGSSHGHQLAYGSSGGGSGRSSRSSSRSRG